MLCSQLHPFSHTSFELYWRLEQGWHGLQSCCTVGFGAITGGHRRLTAPAKNVKNRRLSPQPQDTPLSRFTYYYYQTTSRNWGFPHEARDCSRLQVDKQHSFIPTPATLEVSQNPRLSSPVSRLISPTAMFRTVFRMIGRRLSGKKVTGTSCTWSLLLYLRRASMRECRLRQKH